MLEGHLCPLSFALLRDVASEELGCDQRGQTDHEQQEEHHVEHFVERAERTNQQDAHAWDGGNDAIKPCSWKKVSQGYTCEYLMTGIWMRLVTTAKKKSARFCFDARNPRQSPSSTKARKRMTISKSKASVK